MEISEIVENKIFVTVRVRPLNQTETASNVKVAWDWNEVTISTRRNNQKVEEESKSELNDTSISRISSDQYSFDRVFGPSRASPEVYDRGAYNIVLSVLDGFNATVFAYGQTGSGKTYTMSDIAGCAARDIFMEIQKRPNRDFFLKFSAFEIYNETVMDLLKPVSLQYIDDPMQEGITVENLVEVAVKGFHHLRCLINSSKVFSETSDRSSRSNRIIRLTVENRPRPCSGCEESYIAHLELVDLAGSEFAEDVPLDHGMSTLRKVIRMVSYNESAAYTLIHESKLTETLGHSLLGNTRTAIICTLSPALSDVEQSTKTLHFASNASTVTQVSRVNKIDEHNDVATVEVKLPSREHTSSDLRWKSLLNAKERRIQQMKKQLKKVKRQRDFLRDLKVVEHQRNLQMMKWEEVEHQKDLEMMKVMEELKEVRRELRSKLSNIKFKLGMVQRRNKRLMRTQKAKGTAECSLQVSPTEGSHGVVA